MKLQIPIAKPIKPIALSHLAFLINYVIANHCADVPSSLVRATARGRHLLQFLAGHYGRLADFYYLLRDPEHLEKLEAILSDAASELQYDERRKLGPSTSGLGLALAITLQALQQQLLLCPPIASEPALPRN